MSFRIKNSFRAGAFTKNHVSLTRLIPTNVLKTCFNREQLYTYLYYDFKPKWVFSFVRVSWIHSHKIFHSIQMPRNARVPYLNRVSLDQIGYMSNQRKIIFQKRNLFIGISLGNNVQYKMK